MHKRGSEFPRIGVLLVLSLVVAVSVAWSQEGRKATTAEDPVPGKTGVIEVSVGDGLGGPVADALVSVFTVRRDWRAEGLTDADGLMRVRVPPGEYQVAGARKEGYGRPTVPDEVIAIDEGQTRRIQCVLRPSTAAGIVRDEAGVPLAGVKLVVLMAGTREIVSDASGAFRITWDPMPFGLEEMQFILLARDVSRNLAQTVDLEGRLDNLDVRLQQGATVTGTVLNQRGEPLPNACVQVSLRGTRWNAALDPTNPATSGSDGGFEAKAIPAERLYAVTATADGYGKEDISADTSGLAGGLCEVGPFRLPPADLSITGVVVDSNDKPVAGAIVRGDGLGQPDQLRVETDAQGRFSLKGVCEGPILVAAIVQNQRLDLSGHAKTEGGATDVKIVVSDQPMEVPYVPRKPPSMKGMFLPSLTKLGIDLPADADGKMVLLCFGDMGQRPSRNCVTQLAARATQLAEECVLVVAVQTGQVEGDAVSRWIKDNGIPFQVGCLAGDVDKTQFTWGVASLPHLILTDRNRIVVAEGFSLADLDKRIEAAAGR